MAFNRPALSDIIDRVQQDFLSRLDLVTPILRRSLVYVFSRVVSGAAHMLHGHLEYLSKQVFPDQSDGDFLVRQAALFGLKLKAAAYATGNVVLTGTNGTVVPAGVVLQRADGSEYTTKASATIATGTASVAIVAAVAGADGNCDPSTTLTFESPVAGVNSTATADSSGIVNGSDQETLDDFRTRVLQRLSSPPQGGASADYVAWALSVAGVTRAWCYPTELGAGTVVVRFVRDNDTSLIPDSGEVAAVQTFINTVAPVTATVTVQAPTSDVLSFTLHIVPDTTANRAAVQAELADLVLRTSQPGGTIPLSAIRTAIGTAAGITDYTLTSPSADSTHATGHMATMGTVTFT